DYEIEVHFAPAQYQLEITAEYFDEEGVNVPSLLSHITGAPTHVSLGDLITLDNDLETREDVRFGYFEIEYAAGNRRNLGYQNEEVQNQVEFTFTALNLDLHANEGAVKIIAVYVKTFRVIIDSNKNIPTEIPASSIQFVAVSPVTVQEDGPVKAGSGLKDYYFDKGSDLTVYASSSSDFSFENFVLNSVTVPGTSTELTVPNISGIVEISVNFLPVGFDLVISGLDQKGDYVILDPSAYQVYINDLLNTANEIRRDDFLTSVNFLSALGYIYDADAGIEIKRGSVYDQLDFSSGGVEITPQFLLDYEHNNEIVIVIRLKQIFALNIVSPTISGNAETYEIWVSGAKQTFRPSHSYNFPAGTEIEIVVKSFAYYTFGGFSGVSSASVDGSMATVNLNSDNRQVGFSLNPIVYSVDSNMEFWTSAADGKNFSVGDTITIIYDEDIASGHEISNWTITGVKSKDLAPYATLTGNIIVIDVTQDFLSTYTGWFSGHELKLESEIKTGLKTGVILGITAAVGVVPILLLVLLVLMLMNRRRKKVIKAQLTEKRAEGIKRDIGGYVGKLRDGTDTGEITKAQVKQEMKVQKEAKKSTKTAKQAPAKKSAPKTAPAAKAAVAVAPNLNGAALQKDRTITDSNKKVIANLQKDGSITDEKGNVFARARFEDGSIVDTKDNVIGILHVKDAFKALADNKPFNINELARKPFFVPVSKHIDDLLHELRRKKVHIAVVVDEYGGVSGIVSMEDILEEIIGDIQDEFDHETEDVLIVGEGIWLCDARVNLEFLSEETGLDLPFGDFDTLGGFVFDLFGKIPVNNEKVIYKDYDFIIQEMDGHKINSIKIVTQKKE
ncbi:MAG: hemolysin family protein, partial [Oscillospiraceae bacterium]|nr:hemolysin family protein [Oscillospiraceae bacterium]